VKDGAVRIGSDTVVLNERGLCRLHANASDPDSLSVKSHSEQLEASWAKQFSENTVLFWNSAKQELWIRDITESTEGIVWVWNAEIDEWYRFDNINALFFSTYRGKILFGTNMDLCLFEEDLYTDGGTNFSAYYQSNYTGLDSPHAAKRSLRTAVCATTGGGELFLMLDTENTYRIFVFEGKKRAAPEFFDVRLAPGRFRFLCYRITCIGDSASRIHEANFFTTL
jgi:hypothetical protein